MDGCKVFAPASVANLAVGYDILGLALEEPGDVVIIKKGKKDGLHISLISGAGGKLSYSVQENTAGFSALKLLEHLGEEKLPIEIELHKNMKLGTGLGSSAASAVAGVMAVNEYLGNPLEKKDLLHFAVEGERIADGAWHADNVAPSLLGGIILMRDNPTLDWKRVFYPEGLRVVIIYPHIKVLTSESRAVLKPNVPMENFIQQTGNLASVVAAFYTSDLDMLRRSLQDNVIEPQRAKLIPNFYGFKEIALENDALGFSISGAGPSMFALCANTMIAESIMDKTQAFLQEKKMAATCFISKINPTGAYKY